MKLFLVISKTYFQTDLSVCTVSLKHENEGWKNGKISSGSQFIARVNLISVWREWTDIDDDVMLDRSLPQFRDAARAARPHEVRTQPAM